MGLYGGEEEGELELVKYFWSLCLNCPCRVAAKDGQEERGRRMAGDGTRSINKGLFKGEFTQMDGYICLCWDLGGLDGSLQFLPS